MNNVRGNSGKDGGAVATGPDVVGSGRVDFQFRAAKANFRQAAATAVAREMRWRWLKLALVGLCLLVGGWYLGHSLTAFATLAAQPHGEAEIYAFVATAITIFIAASATPFVPGAEIGIGLILLFGAKIAVLVYVSMVVALMLAFVVGRLVPVSRVAAAFGYFGLAKAHDLVLRLAPLDPQGRLDLLTAKIPGHLVPIFLRHRYLALIFLFNIPGNSVIGGGGGIAFTAALSGLFSGPAFFGSVLIAVLPVPLLVTLYEFLG